MAMSRDEYGCECDTLTSADDEREITDDVMTVIKGFKRHKSADYSWGP